jgi:acyl carrier protein
VTGRSEVVAGIAAAVRDVLSRDVPELDEDTRLFDDLAMDSAGVLELLMIVEDTMGITVDPQELDIDHLRSVRSFADFVQLQQTVAAREDA